MSNPTADAALREAAQHMQGNRPDEAFAAAQRAVRARPGDPGALQIMGLVSMSRGKPGDAEAFLRQALVATPDSPDILCNLGVTASARQKRDEALQFFERALKANPAHVPSWANASTLLADMGRLEESIMCVGRALQAAPNRPDLLKEAARQLLLQGRVAESIHFNEQGRAHETNNPLPAMQTLMSLCYLSESPASEVSEKHRSFGEALAKVSSPDVPDFSSRRDPERRLRIGLLSPDFRLHSCANFIAPVLGHLPRAGFEVHCYSQVQEQDAIGSHLRSLADGWRVTAGKGGAQIAQQCRDDAIDVLIDLAGYTYGTRIDAMLYHAAPVQMTYLGYPCTTGLANVGWRIVDSVTDPAGSESLSSERLARVEGCFLCFEPLEHVKRMGVVERRASEGFTFAAFTGLAKISKAAVEAWARILRESPGSRLVLKNRYLNDAGTWARWQKLFADAGVPEGALQRAAHDESFEAHMRSFEGVDLVLDTFPYNGTTTTCEQLWIGVPVLTFEGDRHASRVGASLIRHAGVPELVATDVDDFVRRAAGFAKDPGGLAALRRQIRGRVEGSDLLNAPKFGRRLGETIRGAWREWCASPGSPG